MHVQEPEVLFLDERLTDIDGLEAKAVEMEAAAEELLRRAAAVRQIVGGVKTLNGSADAVLTKRSFEAHRTAFETRPLAEDGPRGPKAVLLVMGEHPEREWKVVDVKREMLRRGWAPTPKAVEASIKRLRERGTLVPASTYGFYKLAPQAVEPGLGEVTAA